MASHCHLDPSRARARLATLGLTQTALAEQAGVELRTLQRWLAGGRTRLDDAERVAGALGMGTAELFHGVPDEATDSPFTGLRQAARLLGTRDWTVAHALRTALRSFDFIDRHASFTSHPRRGFVRRAPMDSARAHRFAVVRLRFPGPAPSRLVLGAQIARSFRYDFAEITLDGQEAELVELFHTRTVRAPLDLDGGLWAYVWVASEMRELVVMGDRDLELEDHPEVHADLFDLGAPTTRHAVCSRPSSMQLRDAGASPVHDRVVGERRGRVDVSLEEAPP